MKQSVIELQRNLATKNEELNELIKQNEQLKRDIELREQERNEASDVYAAALRAEEEIEQRARATNLPG